jgi:hypothetical protein
VELLRAYLERALDPGGYAGFPVLRIYWQWNHDSALAEFLGQPGEPEGAVIRAVPRGASGHGVLKPRDILLSLDGHAIDSSGFYQHPRYGRIEYTAIAVDGHRVGDTVPARVLRGGCEVDLEITLRAYPMALDLLRVRRIDEAPPYVIAGGLVFIEFDGDYMLSWGPEWMQKAPAHLVSQYYLIEGDQTPERRRVILLSQVLPSPYTLGYQGLRDLPVAAVNGQPIDSLHDVVAAFAKPLGEFHVVQFTPNEDRRELVLEAETLERVTAQILADYHIPEAQRLPLHDPPPLD